MTTAPSVEQHYRPADHSALVAKVTQYLSGLPETVTANHLAGFDQFHVRGLAATAELAELAKIQAPWEVLDAGSGLGGPSRYLAEAHGCQVVGIDLVPSYVAIAQLLADRTRLAGRVTYQAGDLTALPFGDGRFDAVWTQHVVMNIRDRNRVYGEIRRVLKPGGVFAFYDVVAADGHPDIRYPVPWAETEATSFLLTEAETIETVRHAGLDPVSIKDVTAAAVDWFGKQRGATPPALGLAAVMGPRFPEMTGNLAGNLRDGRLRLLMGTCEAV
ncbi:MAG TPA: class I SAM-dependent methyltransferase [Rhodospirillaceae bacterium]|nr:class I SAM-dependent methyltransferase [Rhodospirillaceae bacterium]